MSDLTVEQKELVYLHQAAEEAVHSAIGIRARANRAMLRSLGEKANCHLCGNQHWPICKKES